MAITINTLAYNQDSFATPNKVVYAGPANTFSVKDILTVSRVAPKPTKDFAGVARAEVKRTKTVTLSNGQTAEAIVTAMCSFPVGMSTVDADALRDDIGDLLISATGQEIFNKHDLTY